MSAAQISSDMTAARSALLRGDYASAIAYATAAQAMLAALPSSAERDASKMEWDFHSIDAFILNVRRIQSVASATANGIQATKVTYQRPEAIDSYG